MRSPPCRPLVLAQILAIALPASFAAAQDVRIAAYNLNDDTNSSPPAGYPSGYNPNLGAGTLTVLEAIGAYTGPFTSPATSGSLPAEPLDILGLEETSFDNVSTQTDVTATKIVSGLNAYYSGLGASPVYATVAQPTNARSTGTGNGPNSIVYNTSTMTLLGTTAVTGTGILRAVTRYEFQPVGASASQVFYVYVDHAKSSGSDTGSALAADMTKRNQEAQAIRANAATLGTASVIYMGDFNLDGSTEAAYQTLTQASGGANAAVDPANPTNDYTQNWDSNATYKALESESAKSLKYRDDIQFMTSDIYNGTGVLRYVANSAVPFGNNGTAGISGNVTHSTGTGIPATVLTALTTASDHLPIVTDYNFYSSLGDANGDGTVDLNDLNIVLNNLGRTSSLQTDGNFDGAATIDLNDLNDVLNRLGTTIVPTAMAAEVQEALSAQATPEPSTLALLSIAGVALLKRSRKR